MRWIAAPLCGIVRGYPYPEPAMMPPPPDGTPSPLDPSPSIVNLSTLAGVLAATAVLVEVTKRSVPEIRVLRNIPLAAYAAFYAGALTAVAYAAGLQRPTADGAGGWIAGVAQAAIAAVAASGAYEWITGKAAKATPHTAAVAAAGNRGATPFVLALLLLPLPLLAAGCFRDPEFASFRNATRPQVEWLQTDHLRLYDEAVESGTRNPYERETARLQWQELLGAYRDYDNPERPPQPPATLPSRE